MGQTGKQDLAKFDIRRRGFRDAFRAELRAAQTSQPRRRRKRRSRTPNNLLWTEDVKRGTPCSRTRREETPTAELPRPRPEMGMEQAAERKPNPAARAAAELFLLLCILVDSMPKPTPTPVLFPGPGSRPKPRRKERKTSVPANSDRPAYERYDGGGWPSRYDGRIPPFCRLLRDVRRPWRSKAARGSWCMRTPFTSFAAS